MIFYVCHKQDSPTDFKQAAKITHDLQIKHPEHCFLCPTLIFAHFLKGEICIDDELELRKDVLSVCDALYLTSTPDFISKQELDFACMIGMEVVHLAEESRKV